MDVGSFAERMQVFEASMGDLRVTPIIPAGRTPRTGQDEAATSSRERDHAASWTAYLSSVDADGEATERRFTCHAIVGFEGATHVPGYCHEREAPRMFRVDRIRELACAATGEVFDPTTHFELLRDSARCNARTR